MLNMIKLTAQGYVLSSKTVAFLLIPNDKSLGETNVRTEYLDLTPLRFPFFGGVFGGGGAIV